MKPQNHHNFQQLFWGHSHAHPTTTLVVVVVLVACADGGTPRMRATETTAGLKIKSPRLGRNAVCPDVED